MVPANVIQMTLFAQIQKKVYCLDSIWRQGRPSYCPTEAGLAAVTWMWSQGHMAGISIKEGRRWSTLQGGKRTGSADIWKLLVSNNAFTSLCVGPVLPWKTALP